MTAQRVAFFDVDTQKDFMEPTGALYVKGAERLTENLAALTAHARAKGIPQVASADAHPPDDPEFKQFPPHCLAGTPGQRKIPETDLGDAPVIPSRTVPAGDLDRAARANRALFEKVTFDAFTNPNLEGFLARLGAEEFVVYGVATDYCVRAAVLGLRRLGYPVRLVTDAVAAVAEDTGRKAMAEMLAAGARPVTTREVLASC